MTVNPEIVEIALEKVDPLNFEKFVQAFFSSTLGLNYFPMGGIHDGGADGALLDSLFNEKSACKFLQASTTSNAERKIRETVKILRKNGRSPVSLIYATNQNLRLIDRIQEKLSDELNTRITIYDRQYFKYQINNSPGTLLAYNTYISRFADYLNDLGPPDTLQPISGLPTKTLCVFLGQELVRLKGKSKLHETIADSLIIWSLEGTDPNEGKFLTVEQISQKVIEALPSANSFFKGVLNNRIEVLIKKGSDGRKVNYHKKENGYCLPYVTRNLIKEENVKDERLKLKVSDIFRNRAAQQNPQLEDSEIIDQCVEICHKVIHRSFHDQGLEMSVFIEQEEEIASESKTIKNILQEVLLAQGLIEEKKKQIENISFSILHHTFYHSEKEERQYLQKLSRTYIMLFMLKNEPRIVEYFQGMVSNFNLYVGTDLIVRALSEHMLPEEDQITKNALKLLRAAGTDLILTEKTLDEAWFHLKTTHFEFKNYYYSLQNNINLTIASQIDKILIRAYFYTRIERFSRDNSTLSWDSYLDQFITVKEIQKKTARDELREYLINEFGFLFEDEETMSSGVEIEQLNELQAKIKKTIQNFERDDSTVEILSGNAALTVLRIYQHRNNNGERNLSNPFGYKTWWLTQRTKVTNATKKLVRDKGRYIMRPEFILQYLASNPSKNEVLRSYESIFPTLLGLKLGNRMDEAEFKKIINKVKEIQSVDESRAKVLLSNFSNALQSNQDFDNNLLN